MLDLLRSAAGMPASIATFFVDETGDFSPAMDQMRIVGGLLIVASRLVVGDLQQIHDGIARELGWPARLHARELVDPSLVLRWHASGGQHAQLDAGEAQALETLLRRYPQTPPLLRDRAWVPPPRIPRTDAYYRTLQQVGRKLLHRSQAALLTAFRKWCRPGQSAFVILGHVDDKVPGGADAYDAALRKALELGTKTALQAGATHLDVEIAAPIVQGTPEICALAARVKGVGAVRVVPYDRGSEGLWLADSLLAWCRPPPRSTMGSALDPNTGVRKCIRAGSSIPLTRPERHDDPFDYFRDVVVDTEEMP